MGYLGHVDASFVDRAQIECSSCRHTYGARIWLVVDATRHPELILHKMLFTATCPHCGHTEELDYPLLLYIAGADPPLLFSPPPGWELSMVQDQVERLVDSMREPLGEVWREEWLTETLPVIRHSLMASAVENSQNIRSILEAEELLQKASECADAYRRDSDSQHLDQAIGVWEQLWASRLLDAVTSEYRLRLLNDGAHAYIQRYWARGDRNDLRIAMSTWETVVAKTESDSPERPARLSNLGIALSDWFDYCNDSAYLDRAITAYAEAVADTPDLSANLAAYQTNLGTGLLTRFETQGNAEDLEGAVESFQQAVDLTPEDSELRPGRLSNLGNGLIQLYTLCADLPVLEEAIVMYELAIDGIGKAAPMRARYQSNLASALALRHAHTGKRDDLDSAIDLMQNALAKTPGHALDRPRLLTNYGGALLERYEGYGEPDDLEQAVGTGEEAAACMVQGRDRAAALHNLGKALWARFQRTSDEGDLKHAVVKLREAAESCTDSNPSLPMYLDSLANALTDLHMITGDKNVLIRALDAYRRAADLPIGGVNDHADTLSNRGSALLALYELEGDASCLSEALGLVREAVDATPAKSPKRPRLLSNLATALNRRYAQSGELHTLEAAAGLLTEAVAACSDKSPNRHAYANNLGNTYGLLYEHSQSIEHLRRAVKAYHLAMGGLSQSSPHWPGYRNNLGNVLSRLHAITGESDMLMQAVAHHRAAVDATATGLSQRAGYLANLGTVLLELYEASRSEDDLRGAIDALEKALRAAPRSPERPGHKAVLGQALSHRFLRSRRKRDRRRAIRTFREACEEGLIYAPSATLQSARLWSNLAENLEDWPGVSEAVAFGALAAESLYARQLRRQHKRTWLRDSRDIAAAGAYALAKLGRQEDACLLLEQDRARLMSEVLERDTAQLDELQNRAPELHARYVEAALHLRWLESEDILQTRVLPDGSTIVDALSSAHARFGEVVAEIKQSGVVEDLFARCSIETIREAAHRVPLVYMTPAANGCASLIVWPEGNVSTVFSDGVTDASLRQRLHGDGGQEIGYAGHYQAWRREMDDLELRQAWRDDLEGVIGWLRDNLMRPLAYALANRGMEQATLVPQGLLSMLPLHAACESLTCAYAPNARTLTARVRVPEPESTGHWLFVENPNPCGHLNLALSSIETSKVCAMSDAKSSQIKGHEATVQRVLASLAKHDLWHIATHGQSDQQRALDSFVLLANEKKLDLRNMLALRASARLAVLSACETAISDKDLPNEVISMATGMLQVGARCVASALWAVEDLSTALLVRRFYAEMLGHVDGSRRTIAEALHQAQRWLRNLNMEETKALLIDLMADPTIDTAAQIALLGHFVSIGSRGERPFSHPYYWAGMCVSGDGFHTIPAS